jgi:hypothetical protein
MKTLITLLMPALIAVTAIATHKLFIQADYLASAFFTIVCFLSTSLWIAVMSSHKMVSR